MADNIETEEQELARLRAEEQLRLEIKRKEQEQRDQELALLEDHERDRRELLRLREAQAIRDNQQAIQTEHELWLANQNRLREQREQEIQEQEEADRSQQAERDREDLVRFRAQQSQQERRQRFSNQFESTVNDPSGNLNSSIAIMAHELNNTTSAWSHATLRCNPCTPSNGSDMVTRFDFDLWKSEWFSLLDISPMLTEKQKLSLFLRSSGTHLREILTGLSIESPEDSSSATPYSEMMTRLENHFNSEANQKLEAMIFRSTMQGSGESNVDFIRRLLKKVRFCGFSNVMFELIATVAQNTTDPRLRLKALDPACDYSKLMSYATTLQLNSNIEKVKESATTRLLEVNAIQNFRNTAGNSSYNQTATQVNHSNWSKQARDPSRAQDRNSSRFRQPQNRTRSCYRCGEDASSHQANNCPAFHKHCMHCGKKGHVLKACKSKAAGFPPIKRENFVNETKKTTINEIATDHENTEFQAEVSNEDEIVYA